MICERFCVPLTLLYLCFVLNIQIIFCSSYWDPYSIIVERSLGIKGGGIHGSNPGITNSISTAQGGTVIASVSGDGTLNFATGTLNSGTTSLNSGSGSINSGNGSPNSATAGSLNSGTGTLNSGTLNSGSGSLNSGTGSLNSGSLNSGTGFLNSVTGTLSGTRGTFIPIIRKDAGCGYRELNNGDVIQISSRNFGVGNYLNNEGCTWRFKGSQCILFANCPCADIPPSPFCVDDYLKLSDQNSFNQRFCGGTVPANSLISTTDSLFIRFRSNYRITAKGFTCFVSCIGPGQPQPIIPTVNCGV